MYKTSFVITKRPRPPFKSKSVLIKSTGERLYASHRTSVKVPKGYKHYYRLRTIKSALLTESLVVTADIGSTVTGVSLLVKRGKTGEWDIKKLRHFIGWNIGSVAARLTRYGRTNAHNIVKWEDMSWTS